METKKGPKKYYCKTCDYYCRNKNNWKRHLLTTKHKKALSGKKGLIINCPLCAKSFSSRSGIWKHNKRVHKKVERSKIVKNLENLENLENLVKNVDEKLNRMMKKTDNQIHKISINVFLNEHCKHAMNWVDFVDKISVSLDDLMKTKHIGYIGGISNIFLKNLEDMPTRERPIHCSDTKRMKFYVMDDNKWEKDGGEKITQAIHKVAVKQIKTIKEWENKHPQFLEDEYLTKEWHKMVQNTMGGDEETRSKYEKEIMKNVGVNIVLKDALEKV